MYIKIIKWGDSNWYKNQGNAIYEVDKEENDFENYVLKSNITMGIDKDHCEEINLDFAGKISEEFARELLDGIIPETNNDGSIKLKQTKSSTLNFWKQADYIKQSREDELRAEIDRLKNSESVLQRGILIDLNNYKTELIQILDNKLKESK
jgi:polyhydroxyalkanoate synthesis regulator phasin